MSDLRDKLLELIETTLLEGEDIDVINDAVKCVEYLRDMECPYYTCDNGLVLNFATRKREDPCPHCTKLHELGIGDS